MSVHGKSARIRSCVHVLHAASDGRIHRTHQNFLRCGDSRLRTSRHASTVPPRNEIKTKRDDCRASGPFSLRALRYFVDWTLTTLIEQILKSGTRERRNPSNRDVEEPLQGG